MRIMLAIFSLAIVIAACFVPWENGALAATTKWEPEYFGISITLPERWNLGKTRDDKRTAWAKIRDRQSKAHIFVDAVYLNRDYRDKYPDLRTWVWTRSIPRNMEWYAEGYTPVEMSKKESQMALPSGQQAQVVSYKLDINGNQRYVTFVYFHGSVNSRRWYSVFVYNSDGLYDQQESLRTIVDGIALRW